MVSYQNMRNKLILFAVAANLSIIVLSFAAAGWNEAGAGSATRNTARFAIIFFLLGFASPGLQKLVNRWPGAAVLLQTFLAAQLVHFGAVALLHTRFSKAGFQLGIPQVLVVLAGLSIICGVALTATSRPEKRVRTLIHLALLYLIFLILAADYAQHPEKAMRLMILPLALTFALRHWPWKGAAGLEQKGSEVVQQAERKESNFNDAARLSSLC